jgi:hypothetical protein
MPAAASAASTASAPVPPPSVAEPVAPPVAVPTVAPSAFEHVARLPDDRTSQQIGGKVAEVLWGYYGQQGSAGTALASPSAPGLAAEAYDDAYADTLLAVPEFSRVEPARIPPNHSTPDPVPPAPASPSPSQPAAAIPVAEPVAVPVPMPAALSVAPPLLHVANTVPRYQIFQRPRAAEAPAVQVPAVTPEPPRVPEQRQHVVQLGFIDGTTLDLWRDHPAAKALRAAAEALTLREPSSH